MQRGDLWLHFGILESLCESLKFNNDHPVGTLKIISVVLTMLRPYFQTNAHESPSNADDG